MMYGFVRWIFLSFGLFISRSASAKYYGKFLGEFRNTAHDVKGKVYAANENTLVILGFSYDGGGPDAYFWAGMTGTPSPAGFIVPDEEGSKEVLQSYSNQDIVLRLPDGKKIQDLKWFGVWCRKFTANFGHINIPDKFEPPKEQTIDRLPTFAHGVRSGPLVVKDEKTIFIPDLYYDGAAPDAFFLVGNGSTPTYQGAVKVPYGSGSELRLKKGYQGESVTLTLPDDLTVFNIDWLSMYCITFRENFGHIAIPKNLNIPPVLSHLVNRAVQGAGSSGSDGVQSSKRYFGKYIGDLRPSQHGVKGSVYAANENTLVIEGFSYDGAGPDAYFWADVTPNPSAHGFIVPNEMKNSDVLKGYTNKNLVITLPDGKKLRDIQSFGVWCRKFNADFGHVLIPSNLDIPSEKKLDWMPMSDEISYNVESAVITDAKTIKLTNVVYQVPNFEKELFFFVGNGTKPNERGIKLANNFGSFERLGLSNRQTFSVRIPGNLTFFDVDWFAVYCVSCKKSYGHTFIPRNLNVPPDVTSLIASSLQFDNCEELFADKLQVYWQVIDKEIYIQLTGRTGDNEYFAFGISGHPTLSKMIGADVTVVFFDIQQQTARAVDYTLNAKAQCSDSNGACPDTKTNGNSDAVLISWKRRNDIFSVAYKRPLTTGDVKDQIYRLQEPMSVVAAVGPLNSLKETAFHTKYYNKDPIMLHFGRSSQNKCKLLKEDSHHSSTIAKNAWPIAKIEGVDVFRAQIGPTGGLKGYTAITGHQSWGIAWWINGKLIPEITVVRSRNYTFIVEGGNNPVNPASYHPLYITNNPEGGGAQFLSDINSPTHLVYAGLKKDDHENLIQKGVGRLCEFKHKTVDMADKVDSFEEYNKTLTLVCDPGNPGIFTWVPDEKTPDTVYYQCFTHRNLGWKIHVTDGVGKIVSSLSLLLLCLMATWFPVKRL